MSLTVAYNTARSSLQASQSQMGVVSRNTTGASDPSYSRKIASLVTQGGAVRVVIARASDAALYSKMLETTSDAATQKALLEGLQKLSQTIGDTELDESPAARVSALKSALEQYANAPDNETVASAFLRAASEMEQSLKQATAQIQAVRKEADGQIADAVARINTILVKFEQANNEVMRGLAIGADVSDALDTRDSLITQLSEDIGITAVPRAGGDIALYTDSGVPLFDKKPRAVIFKQTPTFGPETTGSAVYIDGVQVTGKGAMMPLHSGTIRGLTMVRDEVAATYQGQLDELARSLIATFAEKHQSDPDGDPQVGVFAEWDAATKTDRTGVPDIPAPTGLAARFKVSNAVNPLTSGSLTRIRDGDIGDPNYDYRPDGETGAAFSVRLHDMVKEMAVERPIGTSVGLGAVATVQGLASASAAWLEATRQSASQSMDYKNTLLGHASEALSNATDVNVDDETAMMLQLEKSYSASAKLISVIDQMLKTLLNMVG